MIGEKIRTVRNGAKLTRPELANKIYNITGTTVSDKTIGHWETNRNEPSIEMLDAICKITNTPVGYFFTSEESALSGKELNNALIDRIIDELIDEGDITKSQSFDNLDDDTQRILIGALNKLINKKINAKENK